MIYRFWKLAGFSLFMLAFSTMSGQDSLKLSGIFEGKVVYQHQITNPNPGLISDAEFYESIPNQGKSEFVLYIKGNKYRYEYPDRIEIYVPSLNQVLIQSTKIKDSVSYLYVNTIDDSIKKVTKMEMRETIMGYPCDAIEVKAKWETRIFYFNRSQLRTNSNYWRNHQWDFYASYFSNSNSFPLRMVRKSMLGNYEIRALKIENIPVSEDLFKLP